MIKKGIKKFDDILYEYAFESKSHVLDSTMHKAFESALNSKVWTIKNVSVRDLDDYDTPYPKDRDYSSSEDVKRDMKRIDATAIESFVIDGTYKGMEIALGMSVYSGDDTRVYAPRGFDAEGFLKKLGIE